MIEEWSPFVLDEKQVSTLEKQLNSILERPRISGDGRRAGHNLNGSQGQRVNLELRKQGFSGRFGPKFHIATILWWHNDDIETLYFDNYIEILYSPYFGVREIITNTLPESMMTSILNAIKMSVRTKTSRLLS